MAKIKAVLFDLDNTLIDFMRMKTESSNAAIQAMIDAGLNVKEEKARKILFDLFKEYGIEDQTIFQKFLEKTIKKIDYRILSNGIASYRRVQAGFLFPYPHVRATLVKLKEKGIKLGIVSDAPRMRAWLRLAEMNMTHYFDVVITLDDTGLLKPNKMPFEKALNELKLKPEEILFVGDNPERDIIGARKAGMKTCLAKYGQKFFSGKVKADFEVNDVNELLKVVG
ncbi:MAG: TIGR02253 family HAD-type hydrolase [Candidatus Micrarchaeota archaeon]